MEKLRGVYVSIEERWTGEYALILEETKEILVAGTKEQLMTLYDDLNGAYLKGYEDGKVDKFGIK